VGDEVDFRAAGLSEELGETLEQLVVGDRLKRPFMRHTQNIGRVFSTSSFGEDRVQTRELAFERQLRRCAVSDAFAAL
jgi:hypothetical protein